MTKSELNKLKDTLEKKQAELCAAVGTAKADIVEAAKK